MATNTLNASAITKQDVKMHVSRNYHTFALTLVATSFCTDWM